MQNFSTDWPDEVILRLAEQIKDDIDQLILQDLIKESSKYTQFLNPPNPAVTDQFILNYYKSLIKSLIGLK